jgi:hypothetical protein
MQLKKILQSSLIFLILFQLSTVFAVLQSDTLQNGKVVHGTAYTGCTDSHIWKQIDLDTYQKTNYGSANLLTTYFCPT